MKNLFMGIAAMSMIAPSMASAGTAAQALSVKAAAVEPVRAAAQPGETEFAGLPTAYVLVGVLALVGVIWIIADGDSD